MSVLFIVIGVIAAATVIFTYACCKAAGNADEAKGYKDGVKRGND